MVPGVSRISAFLTHFGVIFEQAVKWSDIIVLYSVPTNGVQTLLSSHLGSKPIVFHSFDTLHRLAEYDILRFPTWALERLVYLHADKIVVISESLRSYMEKIGVRQKNVVLLPPAVNTHLFDPSVSGREFREELEVSPDNQILLFSGWLYGFCGLDLIMSFMDQLLREFPGVRLVICGDGPLLSKLSSLRKKFGLEDQVSILGRRNYSEMPRIVAAADICINPYLPAVESNFAFPSKIAEYMASGKPVVASDLPGTRSLLGKNSGVILAEPSRFAATLKSLLSDVGRRIDLGRAARRYCETNFSLESVTDRFETVLEDVLANRGS